MKNVFLKKILKLTLFIFCLAIQLNLCMELPEDELTKLITPWKNKNMEIKLALKNARKSPYKESTFLLDQYNKATFQLDSETVFLSNEDITNKQLGLNFFLEAVNFQKNKKCLLQ